MRGLKNEKTIERQQRDERKREREREGEEGEKEASMHV